MKKKLIILINLFVGIMTFVAWGYMGTRSDAGQALTAKSIASLKFFTVLSNIFNGVISLCYVYWQASGQKLTKRMKVLKLMSNSAVGLTFVTVMVFLGPLYGYARMIQGANFWLHLVLPVLSMGSYIFLEIGLHVGFRDCFWAMLPTLLYEFGYVGNLILNGIGEWPDSNDFYGFTLWGNGVAFIIAMTILFVTWIIALLINFAGRKIEA